MTKNSEKKFPINVKLDADTKSKLETLAFIRKSTIQDVCEDLIKEAIKSNANKIEQVEKLRE